MARERSRVPATYADVLAADPRFVAELIDGQLHLSPRPNPQHALAESSLYGELYNPFGRGKGGPGGWLILIEPELHIVGQVLVPDIAGWRRERMPALPDTAFFEVTPDWVCEVASPSTVKRDRGEKMVYYAKAGIGHFWLVEPRNKTLEVYRLEKFEEVNHWLLLRTLTDDDGKVRAEPFEAIELDLEALWGDPPSPSK